MTQPKPKALPKALVMHIDKTLWIEITRTSTLTAMATCSQCGTLPGVSVPILARLSQAEYHLIEEHGRGLGGAWS